MFCATSATISGWTRSITAPGRMPGQKGPVAAKKPTLRLFTVISVEDSSRLVLL